jgi:ELWxxDGT repeat protein
MGIGFSLSFAKGQRATKVHSHKVQYFKHTPEFINADGRMYFVGNPNGRGHQLFRFDGKVIGQVTNFAESYYDSDAKDKERNPIPLGANIQHVVPFGEHVLFFATGEKGYVNPGIYLRDGGDKAYIKCADVSDITIYGEFAYAAVVEFQSKKKKKHPDVPNEGITVIYQINKMGKVVNKLNITTETQIHKFYAQGNGLMALLNGELFQLMESTDQEKLSPKKLDIGKYTVCDVYNIDSTPYFTAYDKTNTEVGLYKLHGNTLDYVSDVYPNRGIVQGIQPLNDGSHLYFAAYTPEKGTELYRFDGADAPLIVKDLSPGSASTKITGIASHQGQLYFSAKASGDDLSQLYQANKEGIVKNNPRYMRHVQHLHMFNENLFFYAYEGSFYTLYTSEPSVPPYMPNFAFTVREFSGYGTTVGTVKGEDPNQKRLKYSIVRGNKDGAFTIDTYTGEISVSNSDALSTAKNPSFNLTVACKNRKRLSSTGTVSITLEKTARFSRYGLQEKLLFFPDFKRPGSLKAINVSNGTEVKVFNFDFVLVDVVRVNNGYIQLGKYPPGFYILNVTNGSNLYQKIEMQ